MYYTALATEEAHLTLTSPEWARAEIATVGVHRWKAYAPPPATEARVLCARQGIFVRMHSDETDQRMLCTEHNSLVCEDSCMEFFFTPDSEQKRYMNFEINPRGTVHLAIGTGRGDRTLISPEDFSLFRIECAADGKGWTIGFFLPFDYLRAHFGTLTDTWRCNFYKCGDKTASPHFGAWREVKTENPDFHRSEYFGTMVLERGKQA